MVDTYLALFLCDDIHASSTFIEYLKFDILYG